MNFYSVTLEKTVLFYKGGEFTAHENWKHKRMFHKGDYEIILCVKGPIYIQLGQEQYVINAGEVLLIPPFINFFGYKNSTQGVDFYWLHFFSRFKESKINLKESDLIASVKNNPSKDRKILLPNKFTLADYQQSVILIHQILSSRSESSYLQMRDYLTSALLIQLFNSYISNSYINEEDSRASFIKEWIRAHISSTLTVPGIAKQLELNPDYLTRVFKKCTGMTMLQYLNHLKIEVATTLLVRTEMSVKQISSRAYFNDSKVFIRKFHQELGLSPTEYRKSYHLIHLNNPHIDPQIPIPKDIADSIDFIPENGNIEENDFLVKK